MKTFVISIILLLAVIAGVTGNAVYTANVADVIIEKTGLLNENNIMTEEGIEIFNSIEELWNKEYGILTCLYDYQEIEKVQLALLRMQSCLNTESYDEFLISKGEFLYSVERIKKISKASFENIM